jgi:glyoxylase-like metal-dependent hydrolase (beta-lactamase superfamily II)
MKPEHLPHITRRRFVLSTGMAAATLALTPRRGWAAAPNLVEKAREKSLTAKITTQALRGNVSALIGSGGNIGVLSGPDGKLIVDAGYAGSQKQISDALSAISGDPVKYLINTHWHFDHTDGNEWMHSAGATITAHENTRKHLSTATRVDDWDFTFPPAPAAAIPTQLIGADKTGPFNGQTVTVKYYGPSHTDGDLSVYFPEADVLHTGDTWWNGHVPFIDYSTGGNINGMVLKPTAAYDAKWAGSFIDGKFFTRLVYRGV